MTPMIVALDTVADTRPTAGRGNSPGPTSARPTQTARVKTSALQSQKRYSLPWTGRTKRHSDCSVVDRPVRPDPFEAHRTVSSVASTIFWRIRGEFHRHGTVAPGQDKYGSGLRDRPPRASRTLTLVSSRRAHYCSGTHVPASHDNRVAVGRHSDPLNLHVRTWLQ